MCGFTYPAANVVAAIASLAKFGDTVSFMGSEDTFDYNDFPIRPGHEEGFYKALLECMEEQDCRTLRLDSLRESSPTLELFPEMARGRGYTVDIEQEDVTSGIDLPGTWDEYLGMLNKKDRHELRRKLRRMDSQTDWKWYSISDPVEVGERLGEFIKLMRLSRTDKDEFMTPAREEFFLDIARELSGKGQFRLYFLEVEGVRVASCICFDYADAFLLYNSGYDPEYSALSVGLLNKALCVKEAIEMKRASFDFLRGTERYKYNLGAKDKAVYKMVVRR